MRPYRLFGVLANDRNARRLRRTIRIGNAVLHSSGVHRGSQLHRGTVSGNFSNVTQQLTPGGAAFVHALALDPPHARVA